MLRSNPIEKIPEGKQQERPPRKATKQLIGMLIVDGYLSADFCVYLAT